MNTSEAAIEFPFLASAHGGGPAYALVRIRGEALALLACRPGNSWLRDQCCIVIGYVDAFDYYDAGEFPWARVFGKVGRMRAIIEEAAAV